MRTRVLEIGETGPAIVLVHGFADSADTWRPLMQALAPSGRRVVAVDLPHFGQAEHPRGTEHLNAVFDRFVADLVRECDDGSGGVILVGNSLGGFVSFRAAMNPDLPIAQIDAIGTAGFGLQPWIVTIHAAAALVRVATWLPVSDRATRQLFGRVFEQVAVRRPLSSELRARYSSHFRRGDVGRVLKLADQVVAQITAPGAVDLTRVKVPVTLIWGRYDLLCPPHGAELIQQTLPDARLVKFPQAGHCTQLDEPDAIAKLLLEPKVDVRRLATP